MEWVASTLHTTSEIGVSSITTADAHTSAASSRPNWRPRRFKWTRRFRRKTESGFGVCAITFQLVSTEMDVKIKEGLSVCNAVTWRGKQGLEEASLKYTDEFAESMTRQITWRGDQLSPSK